MTNTYLYMQPDHYTSEDRRATHAAFTESLLEMLDGKGVFTTEVAVAYVAQSDDDLGGLNPVWARETLEGMIVEGSLERAGENLYKVVDDPEDRP